MRPTDGPGPFDDPAYYFEPWWPGVRVLAFVEDRRLRLQAEELADVRGTFPELERMAGQVKAEAAIVEGVVLVLDRSGRPDPTLMRRRLAGGGDGAGCAAFVATDLLRADARRTTSWGFVRRRQRLAEMLHEDAWLVVSRGYPGEGHVLAAAAAELGFAALSAHRIDAPYRSGPAGDTWLRLPMVPSGALGFAERRLPTILAVFSRLPL